MIVWKIYYQKDMDDENRAKDYKEIWEYSGSAGMLLIFFCDTFRYTEILQTCVKGRFESSYLTYANRNVMAAMAFHARD